MRWRCSLRACTTRGSTRSALRRRKPRREAGGQLAAAMRKPHTYGTVCTSSPPEFKFWRQLPLKSIVVWTDGQRQIIGVHGGTPACGGRCGCGCRCPDRLPVGPVGRRRRPIQRRRPCPNGVWSGEDCVGLLGRRPQRRRRRQPRCGRLAFGCRGRCTPRAVAVAGEQNPLAADGRDWASGRPMPLRCSPRYVQTFPTGREKHFRIYGQHSNIACFARHCQDVPSSRRWRFLGSTQRRTASSGSGFASAPQSDGLPPAPNARPSGRQPIPRRETPGHRHHGWPPPRPATNSGRK